MNTGRCLSPIGNKLDSTLFQESSSIYKDVNFGMSMFIVVFWVLSRSFKLYSNGCNV